MIQVTDKHWAIQVPSMAFGLMINNYADESELMYMLSMHDIADEPNHEESLITKKLPPGSWQYLFTTKGITEEQARKVVKWFEIEGRTGYYNYTHSEPHRYFGDHKESINSLLRSKGCDIKINWAIIQNLNT